MFKWLAVKILKCGFNRAVTTKWVVAYFYVPSGFIEPYSQKIEKIFLSSSDAVSWIRKQRTKVLVDTMVQREEYHWESKHWN